MENELMRELLNFVKYLDAEGWVGVDYALIKDEGDDVLWVSGIDSEGNMTIYRHWVIYPEELEEIQAYIMKAGESL